ncbi:hypothetical protein GCM10010472_37380 [Pseudonocardia halophobica]|uniref:Uncharacterized protein n=1 Tax=Pseudonocardia halophobica TaxID=29401 RepID=A0A9W6LBJ9_9PSEU|nr:hypothetical protein [Pseudonocardia halophobica]GLL14064.1 hypothetical protein GCM10017577_52100 [Pseudonocardia halophobica]
MSAVPALSDQPAPSLDERRTDIGDRLLASLEALVDRHRARATGDSELIAAEVAHHLAVARTALQRTPRLRAG